MIPTVLSCQVSAPVATLCQAWSPLLAQQECDGWATSARTFQTPLCGWTAMVALDFLIVHQFDRRGHIPSYYPSFSYFNDMILWVMKHSKRDWCRGSCHYILCLCLGQTTSHGSFNFVLEAEPMLCCHIGENSPRTAQLQVTISPSV